MQPTRPRPRIMTLLAAVLAVVATAAAVALAAPTPAPAADDPGAWAVAGGLKVGGGVEGLDWRLEGSVLHVLSSTPLTLANADAAATSSTTVRVDPGVAAELTLAGVNIASGAACPIDVATNLHGTADGSRATRGTQIVRPTSLYLKLADGSTNTLTVTADGSTLAGIRCGEGSVLVVDDALDNRDASGAMARVEGDKVADDVVLVSGKAVAAGSHASALDSDDPGYLRVHGGGLGSGIGGGGYEDGGTLTFNGGRLKVDVYGWDFSGEGGTSFSAGIGAGGEANGTATAMTFNGGTIETHGSLHGAGIGAGHSDCSGYGAMVPDSLPTPRVGRGVTYAGDININGGYIESFGGWHGGAFGSACWSTNAGHTVTVTGGTLIPHHGTGGGGAHSDGGRYNVFPDIGGRDGYVVVTGGSVSCDDPVKYFLGIGGTAWGNTAYEAPGYNVNDASDPNKVFMVKIDLSSEVERTLADGTTVGGDNLIRDWELLVAGQRYEYGAPHRFYGGKLYLWLPKASISEQVTVNLSYIDEDGNVQRVNPLFRNPGQEDTLKRYVEFELPKSYTDQLSKPYDGLPFKPYDIESGPITTEELLAKTLDDGSKVTYKYQPFDHEGGTALGPETSDGGGLPSDEGCMRLTVTSTQFSDNKAEEYKDFRENYWGHRAFGWCTITPVPSRVELVEARWVDDGAPGSDEHDARKAVEVEARVSGGFFDEEGRQPVAATCKSPEGSVQLYVDGEAVGEPVPLRFADETVTNPDGTTTVLPQTAWRETSADSADPTVFRYRFVPADRDLLVPTATGDNTHVVSVRYLPSKNYLPSANPDEDEDVPEAEVRIEPVDPGAGLGVDPPDPSDPDDPRNDVEVEQKDPVDDGGDRLVEGSVSTVYRAPTPDDPHPGRIELKLATPSSGPVSVTTSEGGVFAAEVVRGEDGEPVRDAAGRLTVTLDPTAVGKGRLTLRQEPNGAYVGTTFDYAVTVRPDPGIAPDPSVTKAVENLTHPDGPTRPGDRLRYTLTASNGAPGSAWTEAVVRDALPDALELDPSSVHVANTADLVDAGGAQEGPGALAPGRWRLSAAGADGRPVLEVAVGTVWGGSEARVAFECTVAADACGRGAAADLTNAATASGTRPNPDTGEGAPPTVGPVTAPDSDPVTPPGGPSPAPAVPRDGDLSATKTVENLTRPAADRTLVGDRLRYVVCVALAGPSSSRADDVRVSDPMPAGVEPVAGTLRLTGPDGTETVLDDAVFDASTRTVALHCGSLWGGERLAVSFEATVGPGALGTDGANVAYAAASAPEAADEPGTPVPGTPAAPDERPGEPSGPDDSPATDPDGPAPIEAATPPAVPGPVLGADPGPEDVVVAKTAENLDRSDGTTRVGDTVRYRLSLSVEGEGRALMAAVMRDDVPRGLEPVSGSIRLVAPDGTETPVGDGAYDSWSRTLAVFVGTVCGGQTATVVFDARVAEEAVDSDVANVAVAFGEPPSKTALDDGGAAPGDAFSPAGGWSLYERTHPRHASEAAWPPGVTRDGGVLPAAATLPATGGPARPTIASTRLFGLLPVTGDAGAAQVGAVVLVAAVTAGALVLVRRHGA